MNENKREKYQRINEINSALFADEEISKIDRKRTALFAKNKVSRFLTPAEIAGTERKTARR